MKKNHDYLLYDLIEDESFEDLQKSKSDEKDRALRRRKNAIKAKRRRMKIVSHPGSNRKIYPGNAGWLSNSGSYVVYPKNSQRQKYLKKQTHKNAQTKTTKTTKAPLKFNDAKTEFLQVNNLDEKSLFFLSNVVKTDVNNIHKRWQGVIDFKDLPILENGAQVMRKADLRAFVLSGETTRVWASGLTRFSRNPDSFVVNSSQGGGFKDTWVLSR